MDVRIAIGHNQAQNILEVTNHGFVPMAIRSSTNKANSGRVLGSRVILANRIEANEPAWMSINSIVPRGRRREMCI